MSSYFASLIGPGSSVADEAPFSCSRFSFRSRARSKGRRSLLVIVTESASKSAWRVTPSSSSRISVLTKISPASLNRAAESRAARTA